MVKKIKKALFTLESNKKVKMHPKGPDFINKIELKFKKMRI